MRSATEPFGQRPTLLHFCCAWERTVGIARRDLLACEPPDLLCMGRILGDVGEGKLLAVGLADVLHRAVHAHGALFNPDGALADSLDLVHGVAH